MEYGLYIHLPYCRSICHYCDFVKAPLHHAEPERLVSALDREWRLARASDGEAWSRPRTIYLGGGTPTALDPATLVRLLGWIREGWDMARVREFSVEANPEGLTAEKLAILRAAGVNRLSLGVQSLESAALRALGRIHTAEDALAALASAREAGFVNISVDLMYGVPGETAEGFLRGLARLTALRVPHLSAYSLQVEEGTPLARKVERGSVTPAGEDESAARYADLVLVLTDQGYRHYEVSNFALPGFHSRHNDGYWTRRPYLGLGPGAHSFDGRSRWRNDESIVRYYERLERGELPREERAAVSPREAAEEKVFLGLRRARGLRGSRHLAAFQQAGVEAWARWAEEAGAARLRPNGRVRPTDRGLYLAHDLAAELFARVDGAPRKRTALAETRS